MKVIIGRYNRFLTVQAFSSSIIIVIVSSSSCLSAICHPYLLGSFVTAYTLHITQSTVHITVYVQHWPSVFPILKHRTCRNCYLRIKFCCDWVYISLLFVRYLIWSCRPFLALKSNLYKTKYRETYEYNQNPISFL